MHDDHEKVRRDWRIPDKLWEHITPLLPPRKPHPLGCHRPRVDDRQAMDAIFFVLCTGGQWNALNETSLCSSSSAHRRFHEWTAAGFRLELWRRGVVAYDALKGIAWEWLALDGALTKAPSGGKKVGKKLTDRGKSGTKRSVLTDGCGVPIGLAVEGANRHDFKMTRETIERIPVARPAPTPAQPQGLCLDKGYDDKVEDVVKDAEAVVNQLQDHGRTPAGAAEPSLDRPLIDQRGEHLRSTRGISPGTCNGRWTRGC